MVKEMKWVNLAIGGAAGTFARYILDGFIYQIFGSSFPYGTLVINLLGCFGIGFLSMAAEEKFLLSPEARLLLMVGFLGAFTTFSTFMLETANLLKDGENVKAMFNVFASVAAGVLFFKLGVSLGKII
jgi:CrcB protein